MLSTPALLLKIFVPAAFAVGIPNFYRAPASPAVFSGDYDSVAKGSAPSCPKALTAAYDTTSNSVQFSDGQRIVFAFPKIDQGEAPYIESADHQHVIQGSQITYFNGRDLLENDIGFPENRSLVKNTARIYYGELTITKTVTYGLSRGQGATS